MDFFNTLADFDLGYMAGWIIGSANNFWTSVNDAVSLLLTKTPKEVSPSAWSFVVSISTSPVFGALASTILVLAFYYALTSLVLDDRNKNMAEMKQIIKTILKLSLISALILGFLPLMEHLFEASAAISTYIWHRFTKGSSITFSHGLMSMEMLDAIDGLGFFENVIGILISLVYLGVIMLSSFGAISPILERFFKMFLQVPFGLVSIASLAGSGHVSNVGASYIKNFLSYCLQGIIMMLIFVLGRTLIFSDQSLLTHLTFPEQNDVMALICECAKVCILTSVFAKLMQGSHSFVKQQFGL